MDRDLLLREIKYRASYRGTLELDRFCRALLPHLETMEVEELQEIALLLQEKESDLMTWIVEGGEIPERWRLTVGLVRHYFKKERA